jgi:hypothetical protein
MARGIIRSKRRAALAGADPIAGGTSDGNDNFRDCGAVGHRFIDQRFDDSEFMMVVVDGEVRVANAGVTVRIVPEQGAHSDFLVLHLELLHESGKHPHPAMPTWAPIAFGSTFLRSKWTPPLPIHVKIVNPHLGEVLLPMIEV